MTGLKVALTLAVLLVGVGCTGDEAGEGVSPTATEGAPSSTVTATAEATAVPEATPPIEGGAAVARYDLGDVVLIQSHFAEGHRLREMPAPLRGVVAAPDGPGPFPVVVILHGNHRICTAPGGEVGPPWPCPPEDELHNYSGFEGLALSLARRGYVAFAPDVNAQLTFSFGEARGIERLWQLVNLQLDAMAEANAGDGPGLGVELAGKADLSRLAFAGHSRGGDWASAIVRERLAAGFEESGSALLLIAPPLFPDGLPLMDVPVAVLLPACDGDVRGLDGQGFFEFARNDPERASFATAVYLERGNHTGFNSFLTDEWRGEAPTDRPDCDPVLESEVQEGFLASYAADFLDAVFAPSEDREAALVRLGVEAGAPAGDELYGLPARVSVSFPAADRLRLLAPLSDGELEESLQGGRVTREGVALVHCSEGFLVPAVEPESAPCKRVNMSQPGYPAMLVATWEEPGVRLGVEMPEGRRDLSGYASLSLRVVLDPLAEQNAWGEPQAFSLSLSDGDATASVAVTGDEAALAFPPGVEQPNDYFEGGSFTGIVLMGTVRVPLSAFEGVDLSNVEEVALVFDGSDSGSLFIADLEFVAGR